MRTLIIFAALAAAAPAMAFTTVDEYQSDFAKARECRDIEGRKVWVGERGYYIQSWLFYTGQSGLLDDESASVVPFAENKAEDLEAFAAACN